MMAGGPTVTMANGTAVRVWTLNGAATGFNGDRIVPGPVIELTQGQAAALTLNSGMPHTIHPHGLDVNTANDGVPQTSGFVAGTMMFPIQQPGQVGGNLGSPFTYRFTAPFAGTYLYHCHVDAALHFEMGMYGAVIVRPPSGATNVAWDGGPSFAKEYIWQLSTFDSRWHTQSQTGTGTRRYVPNFFMINGRDGSNLLTDTTTAINAPQASRVLVRLISYAYAPAIVDLGGVPFDIIASDGRPLRSFIANQTTWRIMPGERYDLLITMPTAGARQATVTFQNIRGTATLGMAQTSITSV